MRTYTCTILYLILTSRQKIINVSTFHESFEYSKYKLGLIITIGIKITEIEIVKNPEKEDHKHSKDRKLANAVSFNDSGEGTPEDQKFQDDEEPVHPSQMNSNVSTNPGASQPPMQYMQIPMPLYYPHGYYDFMKPNMEGHSGHYPDYSSQMVGGMPMNEYNNGAMMPPMYPVSQIFLVQNLQCPADRFNTEWTSFKQSLEQFLNSCPLPFM